MNAIAKRCIKLLLPPALLSACKRVLGRGVIFRGDFGSWREARAASTGYDSELILARVAASTQKVVRGEAVYERDSVAFGHVEYSWPLLASLLQVAVECKSLRVIDFGGALGSTWRQNRRFLDRLDVPIAWCVVEQGRFVRLGNSEFADAFLSFHDTIEEANWNGSDVILFCSSLCYVDEPSIFLSEALRTGAGFMIIDRLPVIAGNKDRIAVQTVREPIYPASYPVRLFSEERLFTDWLQGWRLIERWTCDEHLQPDLNVKHYGFFFEKI